jgi:hypothetical protein
VKELHEFYILLLYILIYDFITIIFFYQKVGGLFLSCISPVHMGPWSVRGHYQSMQGVSWHSTRMDSTDKSCDGVEI